ncbi:MAG: hypothetical protein OEY23_14410 [Acidimicrobiia bacterium]|nr:hypothetical protein [Acidimicrobiia bacterium]
MAPRQEQTRIYRAEPATIYQAVPAAMASCGFTLSRPQPGSWRLFGRRGVNVATWGENLTLDIGTPAPGETSLRIGSELVLGLFDPFGANRKNVTKLHTWFAAHFPSRDP